MDRLSSNSDWLAFDTGTGTVADKTDLLHQRPATVAHGTALGIGKAVAQREAAQAQRGTLDHLDQPVTGERLAATADDGFSLAGTDDRQLTADIQIPPETLVLIGIGVGFLVPDRVAQGQGVGPATQHDARGPGRMVGPVDGLAQRAVTDTGGIEAVSRSAHGNDVLCHDQWRTQTQDKHGTSGFGREHTRLPLRHEALLETTGCRNVWTTMQAPDVPANTG
jgi:hypothetical protein